MSEERSNHSGGGYKGHGGGRSGGYGKGRGGFGNRGGHGGRRGGQGGFRGDGDFRRHNGERGERRDDRSDGEGQGGFRKSYGNKSYGHKSYGDRGDRRDFHRDVDRRCFLRNDRDDRRDGGLRFNGHRDDDRRDKRRFHRDGESGGERRFERRDGQRQQDRRFEKHDRRDFHRGGDRRDFHRDGERRDFQRDDRRKNFGDRGDRRDFHRDDRGGDRRDFHRGGDRRDDQRKNYGDRGGDRGRSRSFEGRGGNNPRYERGNGSRSFYHDARRNSDGTISYPSQNPYTDRRPNEPKMPKGMEWSMLSKDERERLRGLSKEHAENIGLHILAAYSLEESDPEQALAHAKWVARQASRIDFARETLAFVAYRQGDYKLALKEFRTAYRMNGFLDYLPFIADCERGVGQPKKAIDMASEPDTQALRGDAKAEMLLVIAGAYGDLNMWDKAIEVAHQLGHAKGVSGGYRMRAVQAEQNFLEQANRFDDAAKLDDLIDRLESEYADIDEEDDDTIIDNDLEHIDDELLEGLGIDPDPSHYPDPESEDEESEGEDVDGEADAEDADGADDESTNDEDGDAEAAENEANATVAQLEEHDSDEDNPRNADDESKLPAEEAEEGASADDAPEEDEAAEAVED